MNKTGVACVIPARLQSSRFPAKLLADIDGQPAIVRTIECARKSSRLAEILCLTDSTEIAEQCGKIGCPVHITGPASNGTERIARNLDKIGSDLIVNLQGDEPMFPVKTLDAVARGLQSAPEEVHVALYRPAETDEWLRNPHRMKAAVNHQGEVLRFQRLIEQDGDHDGYGLHMGIYGYSKKFLRAYVKQGPSAQELKERHELLRDWNLARVWAHWSVEASYPLDVPEDLELIRAQWAGQNIFQPAPDSNPILSFVP